MLDIKGCYEHNHWSWIRIHDFPLKNIPESLQNSTNIPRKPSLILIIFANFHGYSFGEFVIIDLKKY
jgi:hypothetical protein